MNQPNNKIAIAAFAAASLLLCFASGGCINQIHGYKPKGPIVIHAPHSSRVPAIPHPHPKGR